jgi:hypothetical protein
LQEHLSEARQQAHGSRNGAPNIIVRHVEPLQTRRHVLAIGAHRAWGQQAQFLRQPSAETVTRQNNRNHVPEGIALNTVPGTNIVTGLPLGFGGPKGTAGTKEKGRHRVEIHELFVAGGIGKFRGNKTQSNACGWVGKKSKNKRVSKT